MYLFALQPSCPPYPSPKAAGIFAFSQFFITQTRHTRLSARANFFRLRSLLKLPLCSHSHGENVITLRRESKVEFLVQVAPLLTLNQRTFLRSSRHRAN